MSCHICMAGTKELVRECSLSLFGSWLITVLVFSTNLSSLWPSRAACLKPPEEGLVLSFKKQTYPAKSDRLSLLCVAFMHI